MSIKKGKRGLTQEIEQHLKLMREARERVLKLIERGECQHLGFSLWLDTQINNLTTMKMVAIKDQQSYCPVHDQFFDQDTCPECDRGAPSLED